MRGRLLAFVVVCAVVVGALGAVALTDLDRYRARVARAGPVVTAAQHSFAGEPRIVFRHTAIGPDYGLVATVALDDPDGPRELSDLTCERVDMVPTGGSCLQSLRGVVTRWAWLDLGPDLDVRDSTPLTGAPSRTRMSDDGRLTASTVFVNGHSYAQTGFSTATVVREVGGSSWGNLERFTLLLDGTAARPRDRNVWGVSFVDDASFYATVGTSSTTYLVEGDLETRTLTAVREGAECPSVSPDGTRVAYKVDVAEGDEVRWVAAVLDLASGEERVLDRGGPGFDDQLEWLDDDTLLYGMSRAEDPGTTDVWALEVDTAGPPTVLIEQAWSPAVVR